VNFRDCTAALTWRIWRGHRTALLLTPFGYLALIGALTALAAADPRIINGARMLSGVAVSQLGMHPGAAAIATGLALLLAPTLVALQVARMAANSVRSVIGLERALGSMELLCASPAGRGVLLGGILTAALLLAAFDWLLLTVLLGAAGAAVQAPLHVDLVSRLPSVVPLLVAPLPLGALGGSLVLAAAIWRPDLTDQTTGPGSNVLRLVGTAPALIVLFLIAFVPRWGETHIVEGATAAATVCYVSVASILWRLFRPEKILTA
jgi:hypothetical protein